MPPSAKVGLALALAYRGLGQVSRSQEFADQATQMAVKADQDAWAAVGLIDLGSAYFVKGEPEAAERYFRQGIEFASRQKWKFHEARGRLSMASLCMQYSRAPEAIEYLQDALPALRQGKYRRELMQGLMIQGAAQGQVGQFTEAKTSLKEALDWFDRSGEDRQSATARSVLAEVLTKSGNWSEALNLQQKAIEQRRKAQTKEFPSHGVVARARLYARLGRPADADRDLHDAESHLAELTGAQSQLRCALACAQAEVAYIQCQLKEASAAASRARSLAGAIEDVLLAEVMEGLSLARQGKPDAGFALARAAIRKAETGKLTYVVHATLTALAQALYEMDRSKEARDVAVAALPFLERQQLWDLSWRCHYATGNMATAKEHRAHLAEVLSPEDFRTYLERPDVKKLAFS